MQLLQLRKKKSLKKIPVQAWIFLTETIFFHIKMFFTLQFSYMIFMYS